MEVKRGQLRPVLASDGGFSAVVLAAGAGRRFGGGKLRAPWRGGALVEAALAAAFAAPVREVIVVTGADPAVGALAQGYADVRGLLEGLRPVVAGDWGEGLAASLRAGVAAVPPGRDGAFVFLGDMPRVPHDLAGRLAERLRGGVQAVAPEHDGALGNPVLLGASLLPRIATLEGDRGARGLLEALGERLARVAVEDAGVLFDVDTPAALKAGG